MMVEIAELTLKKQVYQWKNKKQRIQRKRV
jgi:hypothetical protein